MLLIRKLLVNYFLLSIVLFMMVIIIACQKDNFQDLNTKIQKIKDKPSKPIPSLPPNMNINIQHYTYTADKLRSPFLPVFLSKENSIQDTWNKATLETYPLEELIMVGSLMENNKRGVIIKAPNNVFYYAGEGSFIGQNKGIITKISAENFEVVEIVVSKAGKFKHTTVFQIREKKL